MERQARNPIGIKELFPVGQKFLVYAPTGSSASLSQWEAEVLGLDLLEKRIVLRLTANWEGAELREGMPLFKDVILAFSQILLPVLGITEDLPPRLMSTRKERRTMVNYPVIQKVSYHQNKVLSNDALDLLVDILDEVSISKDEDGYKAYVELMNFFAKEV